MSSDTDETKLLHSGYLPPDWVVCMRENRQKLVDAFRCNDINLAAELVKHDTAGVDDIMELLYGCSFLRQIAATDPFVLLGREVYYDPTTGRSIFNSIRLMYGTVAYYTGMLKGYPMESRQEFFDQWLWAVVKLWEALHAALHQGAQKVEGMELDDLGSLFYALGRMLYDHPNFARISNTRRPAHIQAGSQKMLRSITAHAILQMPHNSESTDLAKIAALFVNSVALTIVSGGTADPKYAQLGITDLQGATVHERLDNFFELPSFSSSRTLWTSKITFTVCVTCGQYARRTKDDKGASKPFKICAYCEQ